MMPSRFFLNVLQYLALDSFDKRAVPPMPNKHDYLDRNLNRDSDSTFFLCVDTINAIFSGT